VFHAQDGEEAAALISKLSRDIQCLSINRSGVVKELVGKLEEKGFSVRETYYDEFDPSNVRLLRTWPGCLRRSCGSPLWSNLVQPGRPVR
jgi:hypothetical protein